MQAFNSSTQKAEAVRELREFKDSQSYIIETLLKTKKQNNLSLHRLDVTRSSPRAKAHCPGAVLSRNMKPRTNSSRILFKREVTEALEVMRKTQVAKGQGWGSNLSLSGPKSYFPLQ